MPRPIPRPLSSPGFTLIEAMVVVSITAITLTLGLPSLSGFLNDNKVSGYANEFIGAATLARTEAVKRGRLVTICRSENASGAKPACSAGADWNVGWLIYVEGSSSTGVGSYDSTDDGEIITRHTGVTGNVQAKAKDALAKITFNGMGEPVGGDLDAAFNFSYDGNRPREVCINRNGRVKVIQGATDDKNC